MLSWVRVRSIRISLMEVMGKPPCAKGARQNGKYVNERKEGQFSQTLQVAEILVLCTSSVSAEMYVQDFGNSQIQARNDTCTFPGEQRTRAATRILEYRCSSHARSA